jgi:acyl-CoA reductase-like NAD-dependent aldehyde dehydrogenase
MPLRLDEDRDRRRFLSAGLAVLAASTSVVRALGVNKHLELPPDIPFGGAKQSGFGTEMGQEGLEEFTQSRIINMAK